MVKFLESRIREFQAEYAKGHIDIKEFHPGGNAMRGFLRLGKPPKEVKVDLWSSNTPPVTMKNDAERRATLGSRYRIAIAIVAVAMVVLAVFAIGATPLVNATVAAFSAYSAGLAATSLVCLFIAIIYQERKLNSILTLYGQQYIRLAQENIFRLRDKIPDDKAKDFAEFVAKAYGNSKTLGEAQDKCEERALRIQKDAKPPPDISQEELEKKIKEAKEGARQAATDATSLINT